jgi:hypothetical protein
VFAGQQKGDEEIQNGYEIRTHEIKISLISPPACDTIQIGSWTVVFAPPRGSNLGCK